jgi:DNA-directed RNA polymerase beta' subunit
MSSQIGSSEEQFVGFGLLGDQDHKRRSFVNVTSYELFQGAQPVPQGVYALQMGTYDHHYQCSTCAHGKKSCYGHPGGLDMRVPVQSPIAVGDTRKWARIVCIGDKNGPGCGNLMIDLAKYEHIPAARRLNAAAQAATDGRKCRRCGAVHPKVVKDTEDYITFWAQDDDKSPPRKLYPQVLKTAFEKVPDSVVEALGRPLDSHPRNMLLRTIQMPPNTIRPGVKSFGAGATSYHDITNMLQHMVKRNGLLPEQLPAVIDSDLDRYIQNLQQIYYDLILGSNSTSVTQGSSGKRGIVVGTRSAPSILRRLPRKRGRIRDNLLGKRVFIIGRNTISGNTILRPDQVGVPVAFARTLQVAERVQEYNRDYLMQFFLNGRRQYPGCTRIVKSATGDVHEVEGLRRDFQLEVGDVLYRDLVTGDKLYFNRQPTLERSSIGVHDAVIIEDPSIQTFQMNVLACGWYGADQKCRQGLQQAAAQFDWGKQCYCLVVALL